MPFLFQIGFEDLIIVKYSSIFVGLAIMQFILHMCSDLRAKDESLKYVKDPEKQQNPCQPKMDADVETKSGHANKVRKQLAYLITEIS